MDLLRCSQANLEAMVEPEATAEISATAATGDSGAMEHPGWMELQVPMAQPAATAGAEEQEGLVE